MANHTATVTGVAVDDDGVLFATVAYYDGESFFSFVFREPDVSDETTPDTTQTLLKGPSWFTNLWRSPSGTLFCCDAEGRVHVASGAYDVWAIEIVSPRALTTIWGLSDDDVYAGGSEGRLYRRAGGQWSAYGPPLGNTLQGIAARSVDDLYVCGEGALFWHFDGADWTPVDLPTNRNLVGLLIQGPSDVLVTGSGGTLFRGAGDVWSDISQPGPDLFELTRYDGRIWIGGGRHGIFTFDGQSITNIKDNFPVYSVTSNERYIVTGGDNDLCRFDGKAWFGPHYT